MRGEGRGYSSCANTAERLSKKRIEPPFLDSANWRLLVLCQVQLGGMSQEVTTVVGQVTETLR